MDVTIEDGLHLHVHEAGAGPKITVVLHGWAVSGASFRPLIDRWPASAGRLLVPDLRGTGWSAKPREGYTLERYARDVLALVDALSLPPFALVGHSMGGLIAQRVALDRPSALRKLVLVSPVPASGVPIGEADVAMYRSLGGHRAGLEQVIGSMMARRPSPEAFERVMADAASVVPEAFLGAFDAYRTASFADELASLRTPTLVMGGELEQPLSPEVLRAAVVGPIAGATLTVLPGVAHYPHVEDPDAFAKLLAEAVA